MKNLKKSGILFVLLAMFMLAACGGAQDDATEGAAEAVQEESGSMGSMGSMGDFDAMKAAYVETMTATMNEAMQKMADLTARKDALPDAAQQPMADAWGALNTAHDAAMAQMGKVDAAGEDTFEAEKAAMDAAMGEMQAALTAAEGMLP